MLQKKILIAGTAALILSSAVSLLAQPADQDIQSLMTKLDRAVQNQNQINTRLAEVKQELATVKIRVSQIAMKKKN